MAILIQLDSRPYAVIASAWNLCPLEWVALRLALEGAVIDEFPAQYAPHSEEGEAAFRRFLQFLTDYEDRAEAGEVMRFPRLLSGDGQTWLPDEGAPELLQELEEIVSVVAVDGDARAQAVLLMDACRAAMEMGRVVTLSAVASPRPADAPVRPYSASIEGFSTIEAAEMVGDRAVVWLASGYVYAIPRAFIARSAGRADDAAFRIETVARGAVRFVFGEGDRLDWTGETILRLSGTASDGPVRLVPPRAGSHVHPTPQ